MSDIADVMKAYSLGFMNDMHNEWNKANIHGNAMVNFAITADTPTVVTGEYRASGQKAWIAEFGSGSLLDSDNPGLMAYSNSSVFNKEREDFEIRTRTGEYTDLDGVVHEGSGIGGVHGLNAEKLGNRSVTPHPPRHVMKEALGAGDAPEPVRAKSMKQAILDAFGVQVKREVRGVL